MNTLQSWANWQRAAGLSARTISERVGALGRLAQRAGVDAAQLTADDVLAWLGDVELSQSTRATYYGHAAALSRWLEATGRGVSIVSGVPVPRRQRGVPRPVTGVELQRLLAACNRQRTRQYVQLAAYAGLRVHEIAKGRGEDVHATADGLVLDVLGKGGQLARIPLVDELQPVIAELPSSGWWFPSDRAPSGHVGGQAVSSAISHAMQRAGVAGTPHALRHWYGSTLLEGGANLRVVQTLLRHVDISSTAIYTRVPGAAQRAALTALSQAA